MAFSPLFSLVEAVPIDPVYTILILGTLVYLGQAAIRGGRANVRKKVRALKGDLTVSFVIVVGTAVLARYYIFISGQDYFLLPDVLSIIIAFALTGRVRKFYSLGKI
jgi:hypothetical protein